METAPMKILIVEDEPKVAAFLQKGLTESGYEADVALNGEAGRQKIMQNGYDLVLLDLIIPFISGVELCKQIRQIKPRLPMLMLTALGTIENKMAGFEAGADDYLVKPFEFRELLARIKVLTRNASEPVAPPSTLQVGDLLLDLDKKLARRGDKKIELTAKEFNLLEFFMRNKGRVLSRGTIAQTVWDVDFDTGTNVIDVYVNLLRKKIDQGFETKFIHTKVGMGYIFEEK
jgi:two-component system copper resistance phosphate regulon response regulator CusR